MHSRLLKKEDVSVLIVDDSRPSVVFDFSPGRVESLGVLGREFSTKIKSYHLILHEALGFDCVLTRARHIFLVS